MQLRHISPRSIDWMDAMDEGAGGRGWEKLAPEERVKLRRDIQLRVRREAEIEAMEAMGRAGRLAPLPAQGLAASSPSR
jgi:hypothetical protein